MDKWKKVSRSDESRFLIHHVDSCIKVDYLPGDQLLFRCTAGHKQAGVAGIMLWVTFSWAALGPIIRKIAMKTLDYLNLIADQLHSYMEPIFPTGSEIFQQDNVPCHKAWTVLECFEEHEDGFQLTSWPPNSPDFNPIEHILDVMEL